MIGNRGQDGIYLSELLRTLGHHVVGIGRIDSVSSQIGPVDAVDISDRTQVLRALEKYKPDEIYYLAAHHHSSEFRDFDVGESFRRSNDVHVLGLLNFLEGMERYSSATRLFYAASSRVFGNPTSSPQTEMTTLAPVDVYGITKAAGVGLCRFYRQERGVFCSVGILYNHESPYRPAQFVSRKIVRAAVDIKLGTGEKLRLGDLSATVDWGAAQDYVEAMVAIIKLKYPDEFVISTGVAHTVQQFVETAFSCLELPWEPYVLVDRSLVLNARASRPLVGNSDKLRAATGWQPAIEFEQMVREMVRAELNLRQCGATCQNC